MKDGDPAKWRELESPDFEDFDFGGNIQSLEDLQKTKIGQYDTLKKVMAENSKRTIAPKEGTN